MLSTGRFSFSRGSFQQPDSGRVHVLEHARDIDVFLWLLLHPFMPLVEVKDRNTDQQLALDFLLQLLRAINDELRLDTGATQVLRLLAPLNASLDLSPLDLCCRKLSMAFLGKQPLPLELNPLYAF